MHRAGFLYRNRSERSRFVWSSSYTYCSNPVNVRQSRQLGKRGGLVGADDQMQHRQRMSMRQLAQRIDACRSGRHAAVLVRRPARRVHSANASRVIASRSAAGLSVRDLCQASPVGSTCITSSFSWWSAVRTSSTCARCGGSNAPPNTPMRAGSMLKASRAAPGSHGSAQPLASRAGLASVGPGTAGGIDSRIDSVRPPDCRPKCVPRSHTRLNST